MASLIYLILGLLVQTVAGFDLWLGFNPFAYTATAAIEKMLLMGWLAQVALAVVYDGWLRPPETYSEERLLASGSNLAVFTLFNLGLPLVILGQPGLAILAGTWVGVLAAVGSLLQLLAGVIFLGEVRYRLKARRL